MLDLWVHTLIAWLRLPEIGLSSVFFISFISATLLPLGSEPAVFALIKLRPDLFWPTIIVATIGNTLGGMVNYWIGYGVQRALLPHSNFRSEVKRGDEEEHRISNWNQAPRAAFSWLDRFGPFACIFAWLPIVGDPLCSVAGWLKLPFWQCAAYMALGKFLRYIGLTWSLLWLF